MLNLERNKNRIFLKLISLITLQVFILTGMVYPEPGSNRLLRVPMGGASDRCSRAFMLIQEQKISLNNKLLFLIITLSKLEAKLNDENWAVRQAAVQALGNIYPELPDEDQKRILPELEAKLNDTDLDVHQIAVQVLGNIYPELVRQTVSSYKDIGIDNNSLTLDYLELSSIIIGKDSKYLINKYEGLRKVFQDKNSSLEDTRQINEENFFDSNNPKIIFLVSIMGEDAFKLLQGFLNKDPYPLQRFFTTLDISSIDNDVIDSMRTFYNSKDKKDLSSFSKILKIILALLDNKDRALQLIAFLQTNQTDAENIISVLDVNSQYDLDFLDMLTLDNIATLAPRFVDLKRAGFIPLVNLLYSALTIGELSSESEKIQNGNFDINNPIHIDLNYCILQDQIKTSFVKRKLSYNGFLSLIKEAKKGRLNDDRTVDTKHIKEIRGLTWEAGLTYNKLLKINARAQELGLPLLVVENLSYGAVALSPITVEQNGKKQIVGTDIRVMSTKVGSTECFTNEYYLNPYLFRDEELIYILTYNPVVFVGDASISVANKDRTSPHIPQAFKGYRNYFIAIEFARKGTVNPEDFGVDEGFIEGLQKTKDFITLANKIKSLDIKSPNNYSLSFWYPGNKPLYLRGGKKKDVIAAKLQSMNEINGSKLIFGQLAIEPEALTPEGIKFIGGRHSSAFFDDKNNFKEFVYAYEEGWGITLSRTYINYARKLFQDLSQKIGISIITKPDIIDAYLREIALIVLDLDETLAQTDKDIIPEMLQTLITLLSQNKKIVIITEDIEKNLNKRLIDHIPNELRHNMYIFSDGGTLGFGFDNNGNKVYLTDYNERSKINISLRQNILDILGTNLKNKFQIDDRPDRISPDYRIDLRGIHNQDEFVKSAKALLGNNNIKAKVYKVGKTSVKIVLQHKEHALRYFLDSNKDISESNTFIMADSAKIYQTDRELLQEFPGAVSINIGRFSNTITNRNPHVLQLVNEGIPATYRLLQEITIKGGISLKIIKQLNGSSMREGHIKPGENMNYNREVQRGL